MKEVILKNKWGLGSVFIGLGGLIFAGVVPVDTPGLQEFAGGAGIAAIVAGVTLLLRKWFGGEPKT